MSKQVDVGTILGGMVSLVSDASREVAIFVLVLGGLAAAGLLGGLTDTSSMDLGIGVGAVIERGESAASGLFSLVSAIVSLVASYMLLARYLDVRGRLREGSSRFWAYLGLTILSVIGMIIGFVLLIVPGIILMIRWSAASGFLIGAREGVVESLTSSWHATKGHSWTIFFAGLVLIIAAFVAAGVIAGVAGLLSGLLGGVISGFLEAAVNAVTLAFGISVYCLVHDDAAEVGEVFA